MRDSLKYNSTLFKLEKKLLELKETLTISNDEELIYAIEKLIDAECKLPDDECDYVLIDEAIKIAASLRGVDTVDLEDRANLCAEEIIRKIKEETE